MIIIAAITPVAFLLSNARDHNLIACAFTLSILSPMLGYVFLTILVHQKMDTLSYHPLDNDQ